MDVTTEQDRQTRLARLAEARERLERHVRELRGIDGELEGLATERRQHRLLHDACSALEALGELGGGALFWSEPASGLAQLRLAQGRVDAFAKRLAEIEERRETVLDAIDWLGAEVDAAEEDEERHQQEWVIEREIDLLPARALVMPWARGGEEDRRFRRALAVAVLYSVWFALVVPLIELPVLAPETARSEVPERIVRLMMEARALPPPPREMARTQARDLAPQKPAEEVAPLVAKPSAGPGQGPGEGPGQGLLAFKEQFSGFTATQSVARLGSQARISDSGDAASGPAQRAMITTQAQGSSGGINLAALSRGLGAGGGSGAGSQVERVQVARATSTIGGGGSGRGASGQASGGGPPLGRTDEEIQIVFDRHKAGLYRLYNRELRSDPTLRGQMILRLRIEPDGSVSLCELRGTDMAAPQLVAQVLERVRTFDFGAKEGIATVTILYPIDFLPAT